MYSSTNSTNSLSQFKDRNALIVSSSFRATHVLPLVNGRFHAACAKRINVGGDHATEALARRLRLLYPIFAPALSYDRVNLLREEICYFSSDYEEEVNRLQRDADYFDQVETAIEIPSLEGTKTGPSPEVSCLRICSRGQRERRPELVKTPTVCLSSDRNWKGREI